MKYEKIFFEWFKKKILNFTDFECVYKRVFKELFTLQVNGLKASVLATEHNYRSSSWLLGAEAEDLQCI